MKIRIPLSRKVVLGALAGLVGTGLNAIHVYSVPADIQALITTAEFTAVAYVVPEAASVANALAAKFGLKDVEVVDQDDDEDSKPAAPVAVPINDPLDENPINRTPIVVDKGDNVQ